MISQWMQYVRMIKIISKHGVKERKLIKEVVSGELAEKD